MTQPQLGDQLTLGSFAWRVPPKTAGLAVLGVLVALFSAVSVGAAEPARPNIVFVLADDLGYGDVSPLNPDSHLSTPGFAQLAAEGITFTDAHTPSAVCTPTRYGLLTGRYCWRSPLKRGVLNGYGRPLIEDSRPTIASLLGAAGYRTSIVGKWHLGLGFKGEGEDIDFAAPLSAGPHTVGFQNSFVIPASLDFPPYVYFRDGQATTAELREQAAQPFPGFLRRGPRAADFDMQQCLDRLTEEAVGQIRAGAAGGRPFFVYFPLTAPHKPVLPATRYEGATELGPYGDFVTQVDGVVQSVLSALDELEISENTLLIVTSDNGSFMYRYDDNRPDHVDDAAVQGYRPEHHRSNGPLRGTKADVWEAGHRVPFFVRWPGTAPSGKRCEATIGLVDVLATLSDVANTELPQGAGPDSHSFARLITQPQATHDRPPLIMHSGAGMFAIRQGPWKLVAGTGSGGREAPRGEPFQRPYMLFNLRRDIDESENVIDQYPDVAGMLESSLEMIRHQES